MLLQPDFSQDPFTLITSKQNKKFLKILLLNGAKPEMVSEILIHFFSFKVVLREITKNAKNHEWTEYIAYMTTVNKQYDKAIKYLEKILSIEKPFSPSDIFVTSTEIRTREIVEKNIDYLKKQQASFSFSLNNDLMEPSIKPKPISTHQMIVFQSCALYEYLKDFKGGKNDNDVYDFMVELLRNLYKDTYLDSGFKKINRDVLKKNFIDNAYKVRKKYADFEKSFKPLLSKPHR